MITVVFSGGIDSTALLTRTVREHPGHTRAVSFRYGQRHSRELDAARAVARQLDVPHEVITLPGMLSGSALIDESIDVPEGHYADDTMAATIVQGRNLLFVSIAVAQSAPGDAVMIGVHAGDHPVYADCRPEFVELLDAVTHRAYGVDFVAPWVNLTKGEIIAAEPDAPYSLTWSCYQGGLVHCGKCGTCVERREAFALSGIEDPTIYQEGSP